MTRGGLWALLRSICASLQGLGGLSLQFQDREPVENCVFSLTVGAEVHCISFSYGVAICTPEERACALFVSRVLVLTHQGQMVCTASGLCELP